MGTVNSMGATLKLGLPEWVCVISELDNHRVEAFGAVIFLVRLKDPL